MKHIPTFESFLNEATVSGYALELKSLGDNEYVVKAIKDGKEVGELRFIKSKFEPVLKATIVSVDPNHRRQGIASSMYVYAEKELGMKFVQTDEVLTPDGKSLWNSANKKWGKLG
jgi:predicted N-acetyltransferase YhbS